jgi:hypothetical protein
VNLGDEGRHDETRLLEQSFVAPARIALLEPIAYRVVLEGEEAMQQAEPYPAVVRHARYLEASDGIDRQSPIGTHSDLPILPGADVFLRRRIRAVDLRSIPPM